MSLFTTARSAVGVVTRHNDINIVFLLVTVIALMIIPLPTPVVDTLIGVNMALSFTILMLPVFLILANTLVSQTAFKATIVGEIITFLGNPVIALFISLCLGAFLLAKDLDNKTVVGMMNDALRDAGPIVMITAGGGAHYVDLTRDASGTTYSAADLLSLGYVWEGAEENAENLN